MEEEVVATAGLEVAPEVDSYVPTTLRALTGSPGCCITGIETEPVACTICLGRPVILSPLVPGHHPTTPGKGPFSHLNTWFSLYAHLFNYILHTRETQSLARLFCLLKSLKYVFHC